MRFRREDDRLNLEIDPTEGTAVESGGSRWKLVLPKNLGIEDFVGAIVVMRSVVTGMVMDIRFPVDTVMAMTMPNSQPNIIATAEFSPAASGDVPRSKFTLTYLASTGDTTILVKPGSSGS